MHGQGLARFVIGIIGNIVSAGLFLSPLPTFKRIVWIKKSTEEFQPYPYLSALMNCMMWVFYGLPFIHPDSTLVVTINGFGLVMEIIYLAFFFYYTASYYRKRIVLWVLAELVVLAIIATCVLLLCDTTAHRSFYVGILCVVFGIIMYGSPILNMWEVIKTKNSEFMPWPLIFVGFVNGGLWLSYGLLKKFDPNIVVGNGLGALLSLGQLGVWYKYRNGNVEENAGKVQLAEV